VICSLGGGVIQWSPLAIIGVALAMGANVMLLVLMRSSSRSPVEEPISALDVLPVNGGP
jgi:hypothetical protein